LPLDSQQLIELGDTLTPTALDLKISPVGAFGMIASESNLDTVS